MGLCPPPQIRRQQQELLKLQQQQALQQAQQPQAKPSGWGGVAKQPAVTKSLLEIQREEAQQMKQRKEQQPPHAAVPQPRSVGAPAQAQPRRCDLALTPSPPPRPPSAPRCGAPSTPASPLTGGRTPAASGATPTTLTLASGTMLSRRRCSRPPSPGKAARRRTAKATPTSGIPQPLKRSSSNRSGPQVCLCST